MTGDLYPLVHYYPPMILTVLYADGAEDAYPVHHTTKLRDLRVEDFFYFSTLDGQQIAIAAPCVERIEIGELTLDVEHHHTPTQEDE